MKQSNRKSTATKSSHSSAKKVLPTSTAGRRSRGKIAGVETTTLVSIAGVAAAGTAGYFLWKNRETIMSSVSKLTDSIVQPISNFFSSEDASSDEIHDLDSMNSTPSTWASERTSSFGSVDSDSKSL